MARKNRTRPPPTPHRRHGEATPPEEPRILKEDVQPILRRIVSMLDLASYSRLRRTCKQLLTLSPADERPIKVRARCEHSLTVHHNGMVTLVRLNHWNEKRYADICTLQTIKKAVLCGLMEIEIDEVDFRMPVLLMESELWKKNEKRLVEFLRFIEVKKVSSVDPEFFHDYESLLKFIKEFNVKMLCGFWRFPTSHLETPEFQKSLEFLMLSMGQEQLKADPTAWDFLLDTRIPFVSMIVEAPFENPKTRLVHWPFAVEIMKEWMKREEAEKNRDLVEEDDSEKSAPGSFEADSDDTSGSEVESDEYEEEMEEEIEEEAEPDVELDTSGSFVEDPDDPPKEEKRKNLVLTGFPLDSFRRLLKSWSNDTTRKGVSLRFSHNYTRDEFLSAFRQFSTDQDLEIESPIRPLYSYNKMWDCHYVVREDGDILCCWSNKDKERRRIIEVMRCDRTMIPLELVRDAVEEGPQKEKTTECKEEKEPVAREEAPSEPQNRISEMIKWCTKSMLKNVRVVEVETSDKGLLAKILQEEINRSRMIEGQTPAEVEAKAFETLLDAERTLKRCEIIRKLNLTVPFINVMTNDVDRQTNEKHPLATYLLRVLDRRSFYAMTSSCQALRSLFSGQGCRREAARIIVDRTPSGAPAVTVRLDDSVMPMSVPALASLHKAIKSKTASVIIDVVCSGYKEKLDQVEEEHCFLEEKSDFGQLELMLMFLRPERILEMWHVEMYKHHFEQFVTIVETFGVKNIFGTWSFTGSTITHSIFKKLNSFTFILASESFKRIREEFNEVKFLTSAWNKTGLFFCKPGEGFDEKAFRAVMKEAINGKKSIVKFVFPVLLTEEAFFDYFSILPVFSEDNNKKGRFPFIRPVVVPTPTVTDMQTVSGEKEEKTWRTLAITRKDNSTIYCSFTQYGPFGSVRLCTQSSV